MTGGYTVALSWMRQVRAASAVVRHGWVREVLNGWMDGWIDE